MKSSFSGNSGNCLDAKLFEDSTGEKLLMVKDEHDNCTIFNKEEWDAFIKGVKNNEFDWEAISGATVS